MHDAQRLCEALARDGHTVQSSSIAAWCNASPLQAAAADVIAIHTALPTPPLLSHLNKVLQAGRQPVVIFADQPDAAPMRQALQLGVTSYVIAGAQPERQAAVLRVALARFAQTQALHSKLAEAQLRLEQRKLIDRAKGLLMDDVGLSEDQAWRHLRKLAMDRGQRVADVAERIVASQALLRPSSV